MYKLILIILLIILVSGGIYFYLRQDNMEQVETTPVPTIAKNNQPEPKNTDFNTSSGINGYQVKYLLIRDPKNIHLFSNTTDRLSSAESMSKNNCTDLVTAGFYTEDFKHIGLLISDFEILSAARETLNSSGYFYITSDDLPTISLSPPANARVAVQSYPVLILDGQPRQVIDNTNDEARRIIVGITDKNEIVYFAFYESGSVFEGPTLKDLPQMLMEFQQNESMVITNALNLDGGTHSALISRYIKLPELSTVGGYFCMRY